MLRFRRILTQMHDVTNFRIARSPNLDQSLLHSLYDFWQTHYRVEHAIEIRFREQDRCIYSISSQKFKIIHFAHVANRIFGDILGNGLAREKLEMAKLFAKSSQLGQTSGTLSLLAIYLRCGIDGSNFEGIPTPGVPHARRWCACEGYIIVRRVHSSHTSLILKKTATPGTLGTQSNDQPSDEQHSCRWLPGEWMRRKGGAPMIAGADRVMDPPSDHGEKNL